MADRRPCLPPYIAGTATEKVRKIEDAWNTRDPSQVALEYTIDSIWRNHANFLHSNDAIKVFLVRKWHRKIEYVLIKDFWN